jgi:hypothetical protein
LTGRRVVSVSLKRRTPRGPLVVGQCHQFITQARTGVFGPSGAATGNDDGSQAPYQVVDYKPQYVKQ